MVEIQQAISSGMSIKTLIKVTLYLFFFFLLFARPLIVLYDSHSWELTLNELGRSFFTASFDLDESCKKIISDEKIYDFPGNKISSFIKLLFVYLSVLSPLGVIIFWFSLIMLIFNKLSSMNSWFFNFLLAFLVYYFLQVIFLVVFNSMNGNALKLSGDNGIIYYFGVPFKCFISLIKAIPKLAYPAKLIADKALKVSNVTGVKL